jgi:hypothetical protein
MSKKRVEPLSEFEHTLLWMAMRYAVGRSSITSAMLPGDIIQNWGDRLTEKDRRLMFGDIIDSLIDSLRFSVHSQDPFIEDIDKNEWIRFASWLDETNHYVVIAGDAREEVRCFAFNGRYYPIKGIQWWVSPEFIHEVSRIRKEGEPRLVEEIGFPPSMDLDRIREELPWLFEDQNHGTAS